MTPVEKQPHSFDLAQHLLTSKKRANTLRVRYWNEESVISKHMFRAFNDPELMHHAHSHLRRVEKLTEKFTQSLYTHHPDFFDYPEIDRDLSATMIFPYYHDIDQLMTAELNLERRSQGLPELSEKKGHGVGGALTILAMADDYAAFNDIPVEEAHEIMSIVAVMQMQHDAPEGFDESFADYNRKAYSLGADRTKVLLRGQELLELFEGRQLDLFSLTPSQLMEIHYLQKKRSGFIDALGSTYGFVPSMEDRFGERFARLKSSDEPLLDGISERRKQMIRSLALVNYFADVGDMIAPPFEQITRSLSTQYSLNRSFSTFHSGSSVGVKEALDRIHNHDGNSFDSDDLRMMWEALHAGQLSENDVVSRLPEVQAFFQENTLMGLFYTHDVGVGIMKNDWRAFDRGYENRIRKLRRRMEENIAQGNLEVTTERYRADTEEKIHHICEEQNMVKASILHKHRILQIGYSEQDVQKYSMFVHNVILELMQKWGMSDHKLKDLMSKYERGEDPNVTGHGVDSVRRRAIQTN